MLLEILNCNRNAKASQTLKLDQLWTSLHFKEHCFTIICQMMLNDRELMTICLLNSHPYPYPHPHPYPRFSNAPVWVILEFFWTVSLKAHYWSSWILNKCNLSWKTVKYRILSEVCMKNTTVSPQMWCWFTHPQQICWQEFVAPAGISPRGRNPEEAL